MTCDDDEQISAEAARAWWRALIANACALVEDADLLSQNGSPGRARSLVVLAMEDLAKGKWLYESAQYEWSRPLGLWSRPPEPAGHVVVPRQLRKVRQPHNDKLTAAEQYASGLASFWGDSSGGDYYFPDDLTAFESAAKQRNLDKQAGFYVDRQQGVVTGPLDISSEGVDELVRHAAQVLEMHLIEDHTRQQHASVQDAIDSSQDLHFAMLPIAHPDEFSAAFGACAEEHQDEAGPTD